MSLPRQAIAVRALQLSMLLAATASSLSGQGSAEAAATCLGCHGASPGNPRGAIRVEQFEASVHAQLGCTLCHAAGYERFPHAVPAEQRAADCTSCHTDSGAPYHFGWIINEVKASVHGKMVSEEFACLECHDPHEVLPVHRAADPQQAIAKANQQCLDCHGLEGERASAGERNTLSHLSAVHAFLPRMQQHANTARCVECHTPGREQTVHLILSARSAVRDCVECHTANSAMLEKFYRHMAEEDRREGFVSSVLLNNYYIVGATRIQKLDNVMWGLFGLSLLAICVHGAARLSARSRS